MPFRDVSGSARPPDVKRPGDEARSDDPSVESVMLPRSEAHQRITVVLVGYQHNQRITSYRHVRGQCLRLNLVGGEVLPAHE